MTDANYTLDFSEIALRDLPRVGGKNALKMGRDQIGG